MIEKRLTEEQFRAAMQKMTISRQTAEIAYGVLVEGRRHSEYVKRFGITKSAVSQAVHRVWSAAGVSSLPPGFEQITVILPAHQAFIVRQWDLKARIRIDRERRHHEDAGNSDSEGRAGQDVPDLPFGV